MTKTRDSRTTPECIAAGVKAVVLVGVLGLIGLAANHDDMTAPESGAIGAPIPVSAQGGPARTSDVPPA